MKQIGYLLNKSGWPEGESGLFYDYILAENGLFIRAHNPLIKVTVCISPVKIRGLRPLEERIELLHGKIPGHLYDLSLSMLIASSDRERYLAVTWEGEYRLRIPTQERSGASVKYEALPSPVLDIHSHGSMKAFFSGDDNRDEQGLRLYMVVGMLDTLLPEVELRLGVYGYFATLSIDEVFDV
ncbi:MAG: hypothetical protein ACETVS_03115 [Dehalococcoidales bacterium]